METDFREMARVLLQEEADPAEFELRARDVESYILRYCGVSSLPEGAETIAAQMLAEALEGELSGGVRSLTRGDTSISFGTGADREGFGCFDRRLNQFRRIKW